MGTALGAGSPVRMGAVAAGGTVVRTATSRGLVGPGPLASAVRDRASAILRAVITASVTNDCSIASLFYRIFVRSNEDAVQSYRKTPTLSRRSNRCLRSATVTASVGSNDKPPSPEADDERRD